MCVCVCVCVCPESYICVCSCVKVYIYIYIYIYMCVCVCVCVFSGHSGEKPSRYASDFEKISERGLMCSTKLLFLAFSSVHAKRGDCYWKSLIALILKIAGGFFFKILNMSRSPRNKWLEINGDTVLLYAHQIFKTGLSRLDVLWCHTQEYSFEVSHPSADDTRGVFLRSIQKRHIFKSLK